MQVDIAEALWCLGKLPAERLPDVASQAIESGFDGPALRELAGLRDPSKSDVGDLFGRALKEMGRSMISKREAGLMIAKDIAHQIVERKITPYEGARKIWWDVWDENRELDELTVFVGLASGYEDEPQHQQEYLADIMREAAKLAGR